MEIRSTAAGSRVRVRVRPSAREDRLEGEHAGALKISVRAAPEKGRANRSVEAVLASALGVPPSSVKVVSGLTSRQKVVEVAGLSPEEVGSRLAPG